MPTLESNRRITGRDLIQRYVIDDIEDERLMKIGNPIIVKEGDNYIINGIKYIPDRGEQK